MTRIVHIVQHIQLGKITTTPLCKLSLCYEIEDAKEIERVLWKFPPTHPPSYCNEEEIEGFGLLKEEVQTLNFF